MSRVAAAFALISISLILCSCSSISKEQAIGITQEFVNKQVKVFVNTGNDTPVLDHASIEILSAEKVANEWHVRLHMQSNETGVLKQAYVVVVVDSKTGKVKNMEKMDR